MQKEFILKTILLRGRRRVRSCTNYKNQRFIKSYTITELNKISKIFKNSKIYTVFPFKSDNFVHSSISINFVWIILKTTNLCMGQNYNFWKNIFWKLTDNTMNTLYFSPPKIYQIKCWKYLKISIFKACNSKGTSGIAKRFGKKKSISIYCINM